MSPRGSPWEKMCGLLSLAGPPFHNGLLTFGRQADVERHRFPAPRLDLRREPTVAALLNFHAMRSLGELHEQPFVAFGTLPALAVDRDVGAGWLNADRERGRRIARNARYATRRLTRVLRRFRVRLRRVRLRRHRTRRSRRRHSRLRPGRAR